MYTIIKYIDLEPSIDMPPDNSCLIMTWELSSESCLPTPKMEGTEGDDARATPFLVHHDAKQRRWDTTSRRMISR
jgi:hypothetical protein